MKPASSEAPASEGDDTAEMEDTEPAPPSDADSASSTPVPETEPEPEPEEEAAPESALFDLLESADGKTLTLSGHISSEYQAKDIFNGLKGAFPGSRIDNQLTVDPRIPEVVWGNRVLDILIPFVKGVEGAHFHYDKGITTLKGVVEEKGMINQIEKMTTYVMEAGDARGLANQLKVKE